MAMTWDQARQRGHDVFQSVAGYSLDPSSGVWSDFESMYRKSTDFRQISDAAGDYGAGLSVPEGTYEQLLQQYVPVIVARYLRPTYSNAGVGGDDDPSGTLGTWTPPPAVRTILTQAAAGTYATQGAPVQGAPVLSEAMPIAAAPLMLRAQSFGAGPTTGTPMYLPSSAAAPSALNSLGSLPLLALGGAVLYLVVRK